LRYCGREFSNAEIERIRFLAAEPKMTRQALSKQVCREFQWHKFDGGLKDMSCRVALLRMQKDNLIQLPSPLLRGNNSKRVIIKTEKTEPQKLLLSPVNELRNVRLEPVLTKNDAKLWNEYIERYH
jgi:hypothetical protein